MNFGTIFFQFQSSFRKEWDHEGFKNDDHANENGDFLFKDGRRQVDSSAFRNSYMSLFDPILKFITGLTGEISDLIFRRFFQNLYKIGPPTVYHRKIFGIIGNQLGVSSRQQDEGYILDHFFDISPDLLCISDLDGKLKKINKTFEQKLEYSKEEIVEKSFEDFIHADDIISVKEHWGNLVNQGSNGQFEARLISKSGGAKWFLWSLTIKRSEKLVFSVGKDISLQKKTENSLFQAYDRLRRVQDMVKLGYWSRKSDNELVEWTAQTYVIFNQDKNSFIPTLQNMEKCYHPDDRYILKRALRGHLPHGKEQGFVHRIITTTGQVRWLHQRIIIKGNSQDSNTTIEGVVQDITTQKLIEQKLRISNERFSLAMKATSEMIWDWDFETDIIFRSKGFEKSFTYLPQEKGSRTNSWFSKVYPEDIDELWNSLENAINDPSVDHWQREYRIFKHNFEIAYVFDRCFILRNERKEIIRAVGAVQDVTASRRHMEAISEQNSKLRKIAWMHSHILRAPLTRIMSLVLDLKEFDPSWEGNSILFENLLSSCDEMDAVIKKIAVESEIIKKVE